MKCEICGFESNRLDEICYYDINGVAYDNEEDIERNCQNPDALAYCLCYECSDSEVNWIETVSLGKLILQQK